MQHDAVAEALLPTVIGRNPRFRKTLVDMPEVDEVAPTHSISELVKYVQDQVNDYPALSQLSSGESRTAVSNQLDLQKYCQAMKTVDGILEGYGQAMAEVNIPTREIIKEVLYCGRNSGKNVDKFKITKLTPLPANLVRPPIIKECVGFIECQVINKVKVGDHTVFFGKVLDCYVKKEYSLERKGYDLNKAHQERDEKNRPSH